MRKFVMATKDLVSQGVEKHDVGVVKEELGDRASVFFIRIWKKIEISISEYKIIDVDTTGDDFNTKICNVCSKLKSTIEFARNQNAKHNRIVRRPSCKECRTVMEGHHISESKRTEWYKRKPHKEPFECPVCLKRSIAGVTCRVVLDHNHRTGEVRAWICDSCNTGLGRFKDNPKLLQNVIKYLTQKN